MFKKVKPENINFLNAFLEKREALPIYNSLTNTISKKTTHKSTAACTIPKNMYCINDFPSYLKGDIPDNAWKVKTINTYKGSLILLKNYKNTNDYLKKKFKTPKRFRIYQNKLETCFNIEYKTYYGNISRENHDYLFSVFQKMLENRFLEKKIKNHDLSRWDTYHQIAYPLINTKKAVLFVIYSDNKPISFYLNLLKDETIYGYVKSYDIDYSKFSIGFINFIQQLRWCFDNNIEVYDLLKGSYPYKNKLIDNEFYYQKHVIYNSKSLIAAISANIIIAKTQVFYAIINILKKLNIDIWYHNFLSFLHKSKIKSDSQDIIVTNHSQIDSKEQLIKVDLNDESQSFLKKIVYTFLYHNKESLRTVELFKLKNKTKTYLIKGKKQTQKITFQ
ncbi:GNAT family N-acetyltransferase [Flavivirga rizhaonensis]|uniref:GNAT family N-acetyltransferase n=1 Tax=Flavivirga rizhaonensis TaxID=2559571 RepID=A0A4S1E0F3_9FLAO|nr:GNAT family N-acetyltransferase [Flavivirga rizhaonensis]TGV03939.1 GNAT family N-acetyltransferase [Flavivirga rizhaonensis]